MNYKSTPIKRVIVNHVNYENIVEEWLETTADFYINYTKLTTCLREKTVTENISRIMYSHIGQSSVKEVVDLVRVMEIELEVLLIDMEQIETSTPVNTEKEYRKLDRHTRFLKELNQQANSVLMLTTLTRKSIKNDSISRPN